MPLVTDGSVAAWKLDRLREFAHVLPSGKRAIALAALAFYDERWRDAVDLLKPLAATLDDDALAVFALAQEKSGDYVAALATWRRLPLEIAARQCARLEALLARDGQAVDFRIYGQRVVRVSEPWGRLIAEGRLQEGFQMYERQYDGLDDTYPGAPTLGGVPRWDGSQVQRLAIILSAGYGDAFMFLRYVSEVRSRADEIVLHVPKATRALFGRSFPDCEVKSENIERVLAGANAYTVGEFLPLFGDGYGRACYLQSGNPAELDGPCPHVGLCWRGSAANLHNDLRSVPPALLAPLLEVPATFHALIPEPGDAPRGTIVHALQDFDDTAAIMASLDLVITTDTAVAHLAGALGRPLWVLVDTPCDWRWGAEGPTTPWYPTARVFRQQQPGEWGLVVENVCAALGEFIADRGCAKIKHRRSGTQRRRRLARIGDVGSTREAPLER